MRQRRHQQALPIRRVAHDAFGRDQRIGAGAVFHHHGLAEQPLHFLPQHAGNHIRWPARGEAHHEPDRAALLRAGGFRQRRQA